MIIHDSAIAQKAWKKQTQMAVTALTDPRNIAPYERENTWLMKAVNVIQPLSHIFAKYLWEEEVVEDRSIRITGKAFTEDHVVAIVHSQG